jgi:ZIP family zinc transporter
MFALVIAPAAFCATLLGGFLALRLRDRLHLILGFSAGAVVGVAFFDLLPEAFLIGETHYAVRTISLFVALGFLFYLLLDRIALLHSQAAGAHEHSALAKRGFLGAASLVAHSVFDGIAIGIAFQVSSAAGIAVAVAVLIHDFSDGINTMNVVLKNGGERGQALRWLLADAIAPALGIASTFLFHLPRDVFGLVLAVFGGFFLYLGASDLVPESHHSHPKFLTTVTTLLGAAVVYLTVFLAG